MAELVPSFQARSLAFAYIRFSTVDQKKGDSARRQIAAAEDWCANQDPPLVLDESLHDEGLSAYHGQHRKRGALGRFIDRVKAGDIQPGSVLIVEAFDRLDRRSPRLAQEQFLAIINAGIDIVTLIDSQRFSGASIDANIGQLYMTIGMMIGAHATSANTAKRMKESVAQRRGTARTVVPSWIIKTVGGKPVHSVKDYPQQTAFGWSVDKSKAKTIRRIFRDILEKGTDLIAKELNAEGKPPLCTRKRFQRANEIWNRSTVQKLVRGRQVLGCQSVGRMVDGKRQNTGQFIKLYPAVVSEEQWQAAQVAIEGRKSGPGTGRNVTNYSNLFGHIARCAVCGDRLKIAQIGRTRKFKYLACSASLHRNCTHTRYHRTDKIEKGVFALFDGLSWEATKPDDTEAKLNRILVAAKEEATELQDSLDGLARTFVRQPPGIAVSMAKMARQHEAKLAQIDKLAREVAALRSGKPAEAQLLAVRSISNRLDQLEGSELAEARGKIARALPSLLRRLTFAPTGEVTVTLTNGQEFPLGRWTGTATLTGFVIGEHERWHGGLTRPNTTSPEFVTHVPYRHPEGFGDALRKQSKNALRTLRAEQARSVVSKGKRRRTAN
jgi:DNA invertase Pin-like site-specific DNA recombinase